MHRGRRLGRVDLSSLPFLLLLIALALVALAAVLVAVLVLGRARRGRTGRVRVIGIGGAGGNAVSRMVRAKSIGADFIACNTDAQALLRSAAPHKIQIGRQLTGGLGAGGDPSIGRRAAEDDGPRISRALAGSEVVFVTAGLGGGTGSGAAPLVASMAKELGALTIGVVTRPFAFEGATRRRVADEGVEALKAHVDTLITIPNDGVRSVVLENVSLQEAFRIVDEVLVGAVQGLIEIITVPGFINLDFADVRAVMQDAGSALIGVGHAAGEERVLEATRHAISNPLLEVSIGGARAVLLQVAGPSDLSLGEVTRAADEIRAAADPSANVIFGARFDERLGEEVQVTVIATGFEAVRGGESAAASTLAVARPAGARPAGARPAGELPPAERPPAERARRRIAAAGVAIDVAAEEPTPPKADLRVAMDDLDVPSFLRRRGAKPTTARTDAG